MKVKLEEVMVDMQEDAGEDDVDDEHDINDSEPDVQFEPKLGDNVYENDEENE